MRKDGSSGLDDRYIEAHPGLRSGDLSHAPDSDKHADQRDKKILKRKCGMRVHGKSVFVIKDTIQRKMKQIISGSNSKNG